MDRNLLSTIPSGVSAGLEIAGPVEWGLLGSVILAETATGTHGPGALQNDGLNPALRYVPVLLSRSTPAFTLYPNGSYAGPVPSSGTYALYESGTGLVPGSPGSITIGVAAPPPPPPPPPAPPPPPPFMPRRALTLLYSVLDPTALPDMTAKDPAETLQLVADFAPFTAVSSPTWQLTRLGGDDGTAPLTLVEGTGFIVGGSVAQNVAGGASGNTYSVRCTAQGPDGQTLVAFGRLPVRTRA